MTEATDKTLNKENKSEKGECNGNGSGQAERKESGFEILEMPEIEIREEMAAQNLSVIFKSYNPEWGDQEGALAREAKEYFGDNPLTKEITDILDSIRALQEDGVDEETLYTLALTAGMPQRIETAIKTIEESKPDIENPDELRQKVLKILELFPESFSSSTLTEKLRAGLVDDVSKRTEGLGVTKERIQKLIAFFRPDSRTTQIKKVAIVPTDPLYKKDSGRSFHFGQELVVMSHIENPGNIEHEFLHAVINPILEKLSETLTEEQRNKIVRLSSKRLKIDRGYGEDWQSLFSEELIRTFNDVFQKGERLITYEDFMRQVSGITQDQFETALLENNKFRVRCDTLGIKSVTDLRTRSAEYYEMFEENALRDMIFRLYQEYSALRLEREDINFEQFILQKFSA